MMNQSTLLSLAALLCVAARPAAESIEITFAPKLGERVEKTWTTEHELRMTGMTRAHGERRRPLPARGSIDSTQIVAVVDEYQGLEAGRPTGLRRSFTRARRLTEVAFSSEMAEDAPLRLRQKSPFRGASVVFTWIPEEGEYGRYYDTREENEELLARVREDLDARALLPAAAVAVGDTWEVAAAELVDILAHGGSYAFEAVEGRDPFLMRALDSGVAGSMDRVFGGSQVGGAQVRLESVEDSAEGRIARLSMDVELKLSRDHTDTIEESKSTRERAEGIDYEDVHVTLDLVGKGELRWNLDRGAAQGLSLELQEHVYARVRHRAPSDDEGVFREQDITLDGTLTLSLSVAPGEPLPIAGPEGLPGAAAPEEAQEAGDN